MKRIARVEYTESVTGENGETVTKNQVRILSELDSTDPVHIQQVLGQEVQETGIPVPSGNDCRNCPPLPLAIFTS